MEVSDPIRNEFGQIICRISFHYNNSMRDAINRLLKARVWFECYPTSKLICTTEYGASVLRRYLNEFPHA